MKDVPSYLIFPEMEAFNTLMPRYSQLILGSPGIADTRETNFSTTLILIVVEVFKSSKFPSINKFHWPLNKNSISMDNMVGVQFNNSFNNVLKFNYISTISFVVPYSLSIY